MDLKIKDVAELLNVSETTIRRWLSEGKIPAYRLHHQYRFSRIEIENWMLSCKLKKETNGFFDGTQKSRTNSKVPTPLKIEKKTGQQQFSLFRSIHLGGVFTEFQSTTKESIISETMKNISNDLGFDPSVMSDLLMDRENMMPTALNNGVAVPHTRDFLLNKPSDVVSVVFPKKPIEWGALDDQPVHTIFFLFACNDKKHLHLLAKLAHLSSNEEGIELLKSKPTSDELLNFIKNWELSTI